ncbi:hypothetical protein LTR54_015241 [Friedmanniomyces endolithicus]|uniref:Uncharacterized protein n=1 Tax=Friedmanniomyces endolithicus TaxID=329885 RepID=A0AAN6F8C1_9PEZI|nr:hypothetical protein LTR82_016109 [Friedmanniomyces endolithicus]KAK0980677.1 hypothetical protein LTR54_015241 [Friedmanniomyces endolithicus]
MWDSGASHRPAGVTAHVKPTRFFVPDPHESRRPSYASSMFKYSQATSKPIDCAAFQAMLLEGPKSLVPQPLYIAVRPGADRTPALQRGPATKRSVHGDISHIPELQHSIFEAPRPAPEPPRQSRGRGPPLAYENHQPRQSRARSLSSSFREGMQKIGSFARRRSSVAKEDIRLVMDSMRGDECGLGERMSANEKAVLAEEYRVRKLRQEEAERRAEAQRSARDNSDRYPRALAPIRGLRRVQGSIGRSAGGPQESALPRKMRTLSGSADRLSRLGPLIHAGPQNVNKAILQASDMRAPVRPRKMKTLSGTIDRLPRLGPPIDAGPQSAKTSRLQSSRTQASPSSRSHQPATKATEVARAERNRHDSVLADQHLYDQVLDDDQVWWQNIARGGNIEHAIADADRTTKYAIVQETAPSHVISSKGRQHKIKRKPVPQQQRYEPPCAGRAQ